MKTSSTMVHMYTHTGNHKSPPGASAPGPLLGFSLGPQAPGKAGQAHTVYLSRDPTYILALSLVPGPV